MDYIQHQKDLEETMLQAGVDKYYQRLSIRGIDSGKVGQRVLSVMTEKFSRELKATMDHVLNPKRRGRPAKDAALIRKLATVNPGVLALFSVRAVLQSVGNASRSTNQVANLIGMMVAEHDDWAKLSSAKPGLAYVVRENLKDTQHDDHRRKVVRHVVSQYSETGWTEAERGLAGKWLLDECIRCTEMADIVVVPRSKEKKSFLEATPKTQAMLVDGHIRNEELKPVYTPMVCKPQPWSGPYNGGYLSRRMPVIKTRDQDMLKRLAEADMPEVYAALNTLQETPYRVNRAILDVISSAYEANHQLPDMVNRENIPLPAKPRDIDTNEEARKQWKVAAAKVHKDNAAIHGERVAFILKLNMARNFADYPELYFPHQLDWRGRAYPVPVFLNPQGDDMAKSMLQFAEGKPLGEEGVLWFKVHIANLFGVDKVSFGDRIAWVDEHQEHLLDSAVRPVEGQGFWMTADKPWQALAACFEFAGYKLQGEDYISHLPIAMDGSCNGLQHLSAMLLDSTGGAAVNLIPQAKPADIYTLVAKRTEEKVRALRDEHGVENPKRDVDTYLRAQTWLDMGISRKLVKRPVMTTPYGVTGFGMRDQLTGEVEAQQLVDNPKFWLRKETDQDEKAAYYAASFIAPLIDDAIAETVLAARSVMDWYVDCGRMAGKEGIQLSWVSPIGLPAKSNYMKTKGEKVEATIGGRHVQVWLAYDTKTLNVRKIANGMSPNVVHSYDGAHMMATVNACTKAGIKDLAMVHDSYATHACDVGEMSMLLREEFVRMYSVNVLADLHSQFQAQCPGLELPEPPARGDLDISQVLDSYFFFA